MFRILILCVFLITSTKILGCSTVETEEIQQNQELILKVKTLEEQLSKAQSTIEEYKDENQRLSSELLSVAKKQSDMYKEFNELNRAYREIVNE